MIVDVMKGREDTARREGASSSSCTSVCVLRLPLGGWVNGGVNGAWSGVDGDVVGVDGDVVGVGVGVRVGVVDVVVCGDGAVSVVRGVSLPLVPC